MCGIAGFLNLTTSDRPGAMRTQVERMAAAVCHRGPDGAGTWVDPGAGIALGHRRLAVLDLSPAGDQPMVSASGRYVIAYNGEIYNAQELRADLESTDTTGAVFRGRSDTEVQLAALERWGLPGGVRRLNGMFAFALWDREERILYLVRDRLGEKPLYYGWNGRCFLFGSELKALRAYPGFHDEIDRTAVALLLRHGYIPAPYSIHEGISKLPPAAILSLRALGGRCDPEINAYWSAKAVAERGCSNPLRVSGPEAVEQLDRLVREAVRIRMVADVPVGAMLSGGIDSSAVVALMQAQSSRPVRTFSIGFHEDAYNEAGHAKHVAGYLGCQHTEVYVTAADALAIVPRLPAVYDEPFADSSQIPSFLLSSLVRGSVTVSLSGDGGDEIFGGYPRYLWASRIWNACRWMPRGSRRHL